MNVIKHVFRAVHVCLSERLASPNGMPAESLSTPKYERAVDYLDRQSDAGGEI
jgi:hypothetical protein